MFNKPQHVQQTSAKIATTWPMLASFEPANSRLAKLAISTPVANSWLASLWGYHFNGRVLLLGPWFVLMNLKFTSSSFQTAWTSIRFVSISDAKKATIAVTCCHSQPQVVAVALVYHYRLPSRERQMPMVPVVEGLACPKLVRWETRPNHKSTTGDGL
jgi:hypothetical protein